jgi:hypothetical protein
MKLALAVEMQNVPVDVGLAKAADDLAPKAGYTMYLHKSVFC